MSSKPISFILRRRQILLNLNLRYSLCSNYKTLKPYSTAQNPPTDPNKPSNLSARLSFVFDHIDAIERERAQKDETLQRIRAWRESKKSSSIASDTPVLSAASNVENVPLGEEVKEDGVDAGKEMDLVEVGSKLKKEVELVHPWPEWIELMERLVQQNYFDHKREDEDGMVKGLGFDMDEIVEEGVDFTRDFKTVQTACLNFGRDRFDILR